MFEYRVENINCKGSPPQFYAASASCVSSNASSQFQSVLRKHRLLLCVSDPYPTRDKNKENNLSEQKLVRFSLFLVNHLPSESRHRQTVSWTRPVTMNYVRRNREGARQPLLTGGLGWDFSEFLRVTEVRSLSEAGGLSSWVLNVTGSIPGGGWQNSSFWP